MQKKIAIVYGGYSSEEEISLLSGKLVAENLPSEYKPYLIRINNDGWYLEENGANIPVDKNDFSVEIDGNKINFDKVFIAIHGTPGEDGKLQAYFDMLNIKYSTSNALASAITFNKWTCNTLLLKNGYKCANSVVLRDSNNYSLEKIRSAISLPCFVKPNNGGSSFGITKVKQDTALAFAIELAFQEGNEVLIEDCINGIEVTCGVVQMNQETIALPLTEIVSDNEFFDYMAKYKGESQEITPARISEEMTVEIQRLSKEIFELLNLKGMARIDYMIDGDEMFIIEVNTIPGMSNESIIPQQAQAAGMTLPELLGGIIG